MSNLIDLVGLRFGRLVVSERAPRVVGAQAQWRCRCDCGAESVVRSQGLRTGRTRSCGCLVRERIRTLRRTHGRSRTPEYVIWSGMKGRCTNPTNTAFPRYGGRGITVDPRWVASFDAFLADMGPRPSQAHSIERLDNDGPYAPGNCVWADRVTQNRHRRSNVLLTVRGRTQTVSAWAAEVGVPPYRIRQRLRAGASAEWALRLEIGPSGKRYRNPISRSSASRSSSWSGPTREMG
jgi:hypothetical protein